MRENDGGDEPNQGTLHGIYGNITTKPSCKKTVKMMMSVR
jgi:hypothetical protein